MSEAGRKIPEQKSVGDRSGGDSNRPGALELFPAVGPSSPSRYGLRKAVRRTENSVASARSSIKQLYDVIRAFDEEKRGLVRSIGFGGLLRFPPLRQINRRFAVWLMSRVDPLAQEIVIDAERRIKFDKADVGRVFGVPCVGRNVLELGVPRKDVVSQVASFYRSVGCKESRSIKEAQEVLERKFESPMNVDDSNAFKVAFVIYVMSTLLSPGSKFDYVSIDYWNALADPSMINAFDWGDYVIKRLYQAVVKLKSEVSMSKKVMNITGCSLFLQVLYLDSIDIGFLNLDHRELPRIRHFSDDTMKSMILADTICGVEDVKGFGFGKSQLRSAADAFYSWGSPQAWRVDDVLKCGISNSDADGSNGSSWSVGFTTEAGGISSADIGDLDSEAAKVSDGVIISPSVLSVIIQPFMEGFSYICRRDSNGRCQGEAAMTEDMPNELNCCSHELEGMVKKKPRVSYLSCFRKEH